MVSGREDSTLDIAVSQMRSNHISYLQVAGRAYNSPIFGQQTIAHSVYAFGIAGSDSLLQHLNSMATYKYLTFSCLTKSGEEHIDARGLFVHSMDQPFGNSSRSLERLMRHHIQNAHISRMADTRDDRQCVLNSSN